MNTNDKIKLTDLAPADPRRVHGGVEIHVTASYVPSRALQMTQNDLDNGRFADR